MTLPQLLANPLARAWAVTLLHFVWQGALLGIAAALLLQFFPLKAASRRYALCLVTLLAMAACLPATFLIIASRMNVAAAGTVAIHSETNSPLAAQPIVSGPIPLAPVVAATPVSSSSTEMSFDIPADEDWMEKTEVLYPWILAMWGAGVVLFSLRILASWIGTRLLVRRRLPVPAALAETFSRLARQLALRRVPEIFASAKVADAAVIGFLKPIVLLPAAWLTELSPDVLEAVLAHELAHIRRYDLWVNLLQRAIESVLFYHPAVWWVSRRVRAEREMCCDELAISVTHQRLAYVTALESVARHRAGLVKPALALTLGDQDMALLKRIRHLLGMSPASAGGGSWPAIVLALALPAGLWLAWDTTAPGATAAADETAILGDGPHESPPPPKNPDEDRRDRDRTDDEDRPPRPRRFEGAGLRDDDRRGPPPRDEGPRRGPPEGDEDGPPRRRPDELNDTSARPRPGGVGRFREPLGGRNRRPEEDEFRRPGPDGAPQEELVRLLMELRHEVAELRNEVRELRGERGRGSEFDRDGERQYRLNPPPAKRKIGDDDDARPPVLPDNRMRRGRLDDEDADDGRDLMRRRGAPSLRRPGRPPENRPGATRDPRELAPYRVPMPVDEGAPSRREAPPDPTVKAPPTGPAST